MRFPDTAVVRHELLRIAAALEALGVTAVFTSERTDGNSLSPVRHSVEEFALNNVIMLRNTLTEGRRRRTVEIVKFRGARHRTGEWQFTIDPGAGIVVMPIAYLRPRSRPTWERVTLGNSGLDAMCRGGVYRDAIVMLTGPTGTGKTLTSLFFTAAAHERGERALFYSFDETPEQLHRSAQGWGLDLKKLIGAGTLRLTSEYPESASIEDHFIQLKRNIDEFRPHRVAIDSLSALQRVAGPRALLDFVISLGAVLQSNEITTLITSAPTSSGPSDGAAITVELASLTDVNLLLRYVEHVGVVRRALAVLKTRGTDHDHHVREVFISERGMHVGEPMRSVAHIFVGSGVVTGPGTAERGEHVMTDADPSGPDAMEGSGDPRDG
ncbi:ATPase domain-containing protein [Streptomyces sp. NPDC059009]|uniref:ATPase domain-containing protein n=1 Tax=Streptomyces sp. NPDC059009 TaxID=3346694 RepID=UPI0036BD3EBF